MVRANASIWMSGDEALEFLAPIEPDLHNQIALLQAANRDGRVRARRRGIEQERRRRARNGLGDPDDMPAEETWRRYCIDFDPAPEDLEKFAAYFAAHSEFLRENVIACFGEVRPPPSDVETLAKEASGKARATQTEDASSTASALSDGDGAAATKTGQLERYPGRPSIRPAVLKKWRDRAAAGLDYDTLAAEARWLHDWAHQTYPGEPHLPSIQKVVENQIRAEYRKFHPIPSAPNKNPIKIPH